MKQLGNNKFSFYSRKMIIEFKKYFLNYLIDVGYYFIHVKNYLFI